LCSPNCAQDGAFLVAHAALAFVPPVQEREGKEGQRPAECTGELPPFAAHKRESDMVGGREITPTMHAKNRFFFVVVVLDKYKRATFPFFHSSSYAYSQTHSKLVIPLSQPALFSASLALFPISTNGAATYQHAARCILTYSVQPVTVQHCP
jgi:hypothetical protein